VAFTSPNFCIVLDHGLAGVLTGIEAAGRLTSDAAAHGQDRDQRMVAGDMVASKGGSLAEAHSVVAQDGGARNQSATGQRLSSPPSSPAAAIVRHAPAEHRG